MTPIRMEGAIDARSHTNVLANLIVANRFRTFVEIGVLRGRAMRRILKSVAGDVLHEYWAVDSWAGPDVAMQDSMYRRACLSMRHFANLRVVRMDSVEASALFGDGDVDMAFIDADHSFDAVAADIAAWMPKVRHGGILCGHDYYKSGRKHPGVRMAVDEAFGRDGVTVLPGCVWVVRT